MCARFAFFTYICTGKLKKKILCYWNYDKKINIDK